MGKRQLYGAALTAKMIKKRLTALYPGVKFSVTSDTFSMGDSVSIEWKDGPMYETVDTIAREYQHGSRNSMHDIYEYERIDKSLGCDGAKWVSCSRDMSDKYKAMLVAKAIEQYGSMDSDDHLTYSRRLLDVEREFFPYPEAEIKSGATAAQSFTSISELDYEVIKDVDTRDNSEIYVVKIKTKVDDFNSLRQMMKALGDGYYSRFKRGFIFKLDPTSVLAGGSDNVDNAANPKVQNIA